MFSVPRILSVSRARLAFCVALVLLGTLAAREGAGVVERKADVALETVPVTLQQRARLLGILWSRGSFNATRSEWSVDLFVAQRDPQGAAAKDSGGRALRDDFHTEKMRALVEFLTLQIGGAVRTIGDEAFLSGLPWERNWPDSHPDELAVHDVNFLAGVIDGGGAASGVVAEQNMCCDTAARMVGLFDLLTTGPNYRDLGFYLAHPRHGEMSREHALKADSVSVKLRASHFASVHDWGFVNPARVPGFGLFDSSSDPHELGEPFELPGEDVDDEFKCFGLVATIMPLPGKRFVYGTRQVDIIRGSEQSDVIYGRGGDDIICSGGGRDEVHGGDGDDRISGDADDDVMHGDNGNDTMFGGSGHDTLFGDRDHDRLSGGDGNDRLFGGLGQDQLFGNEGIDRLRGNEGMDRLFGGHDADIDTCYTGGQPGDYFASCP